MIHRKVLSFVMLATCLTPPSAALADHCATGIVTAVRIGNGGGDSGNIIEAQIDTTGNKWWVVNKGDNLNDYPGSGLLHLLTLSKAAGNKVTLIDDYGTRCDDFNGVWLLN